MEIREDDIPVSNEIQRKVYQLGYDQAAYEIYDVVKEYLDYITKDNKWHKYQGWKMYDIVLDIVNEAIIWKSQQD